MLLRLDKVSLAYGARPLLDQVSLQLDEGDPIPLKPLDAVVQRGTNHSWVNTGAETALLMAVMVGGK